MNDNFIYRPYRSSLCILPFTVAIAVANFFLAGITLPQGDFTLFIFLLIGFLVLYAAKIVYDTMRMVILFDVDGLQVIGTQPKNDSYFSWKDISFTYCVRNYRGFYFLVLSPETLTSKEAKRLVRRWVNPLKMCVEDAMVIPADNIQKNSRLKEFIACHTTYESVD